MKTQTISKPSAPKEGEVVFLRFDVFDALCDARGWTNDHQRAKNIGLASHTTIRRLREGEGNPGGKFIGLTLAALGVPFEVLFGRRAA